MRPRLFAVVCVAVICGLLSISGSGQSVANAGDRVESRSSTSPAPQRVESIQFTYLGTVTRSGKFRDASRSGCMKESFEDDPARGDPEEMGVPPWMIHSQERTLLDYDSGQHKRAVVSHRSRVAGLIDPTVHAVYGPPVVLHTPMYIATDAANRLIVSDLTDRSVHVLNTGGKGSFRIAAGGPYRLKAPEGVATDGDGNIFIADSKAHAVWVYDPNGSFLRQVGMIGDESVLEHPTAIAIDRKRGRIYVADTPRDVVVVLDIRGRYLGQIGRRRDGRGVPEFRQPGAIAVDERGLAVLDSGGSRIWLLNPEGRPLKSILVRDCLRANYKANSIAFDGAGNIFATSAMAGGVIVMNRNGNLIGVLGHSGAKRGEFIQPMGVWLDSAQHLYVADSQVGRVQVFSVAKDPDLSSTAEVNESDDLPGCMR